MLGDKYLFEIITEPHKFFSTKRRGGRRGEGKEQRHCDWVAHQILDLLIKGEDPEELISKNLKK